MKNIVQILKHRFQEGLVPVIFFFMVFHLLVLTKVLILKAYAVTTTDVAVATLGAFIVAKAVMFADKLPFITVFSGRPLIFSVLWKTLIYGILGFIFRCLEELIPLLSRHEGFGAAAEHLVDEVSWPLFWALQIWLMVALMLYNSFTELDKHFGAGSVRKAFLG